ncbi:ARF GAP-like zinc finger-containing protein [Histomonas meleagridis]|uniref:ARF GAP-like zinc finger-containing protein n=1 Tax=Histomonas meleagridis TaxID=135588 RepID=UPI00355AC24A|nr:ARF GAP-like zinc finger-containing protein [Histomonas meleagridis]KAH0801911.1 ARF GAP-like zinc finger-containing protein [Histomonas meleagridis]
MKEAKQNDYFQYFDPSPFLEQDVLQRVKKQVELIPVLNRIDTSLKQISGHLSGIKDDITLLEKSCEGLNINKNFTALFSTLGSFLQSCGTNVMAQCQMHLSAQKEVVLPELSNLKNEFVKVNSEYQKVIEDYGNLTPKTKPEVTSATELALKKSMIRRAEVFYEMCQKLHSSEENTIPSIIITIAHFISYFASTLKNFITQNEGEIYNVSTYIESNEPVLKSYLKEINTLHGTKNPSYQYAVQSWDCRDGIISPTTNLIHASSVMWIRSHKLVTNWTRKHVTFNDGLLSIYDPTNGRKDQSYQLSIVTAVPVPKKKRRFCFKVQSPQLTIQLEAISKFDMDEWISIFTEHNNKLLIGDSKDTGSQRQCCADCGSTDAQWCSLNWCVSLCLKCCGTHRQLSTKTSKVRSLMLDKMHPFLQNMLTEMTNSAANKLLLERPCDMEVSPRMNDQLRSIYITRKYQQKEWATKAPIPDPFEAILNNDHRSLFHALNFGKTDEQFDSVKPLHAACAKGDPLLVAIAASCSAFLDVQDLNGWTPLCYAVFYRNVEVVKFLIDFGAQPDKAGIDLFTLVLIINDEEMNKLLLDKAATTPKMRVYAPRTTKFAPQGKEDLKEIVATNENIIVAASLAESIQAQKNS